MKLLRAGPEGGQAKGPAPHSGKPQRDIREEFSRASNRQPTLQSSRPAGKLVGRAKVLPHGISRGSQASKALAVRDSVARACARFLKVLLGILREIGDQNAYARHLAAHGTLHSGTEWRRFSDSRFRAKYQNAKCC